ncbi:FkbM family methyltransferase [Candidatus Pelagibacter communis]|uniref:FkbM family methyltransferase n=1 Tax=Candidatus Pelagibacter TaxID=198251 RepID=UPI003EE3A599
MIGNLVLKALMFFINLIDLKNKLTVINFFKKRLNNKSVYVFDIGAHKGETIDLFCKNLNVKTIYSFEPNINLFKKLKSKKKYSSDNIKLFNIGFGKKTETKYLNIFEDTSSSTLNILNKNTEYFKRKEKLFSLFQKKEIFLAKKQSVKISNFSEFISEKLLDQIDILKIDTEGYEYNILSGINTNDFKKIKFIYFEHHYDLMINKGYKYSDVKKLLEKNNFKMKLKIRMKFRKSFEYIYENKS